LYILGQENDDGSWGWGFAFPNPEGGLYVMPYWGEFEPDKRNCL